MTMMMIMHAIVLVHWKYSQHVDMSLDLDTLSWSRVNQSCSYSLMLCFMEQAVNTNYVVFCVIRPADVTHNVLNLEQWC